MCFQRFRTLICGLSIVATSLASGESAKAADEIHRLTVTPQAVERPLMKYRLFPAEYELHEGNAAPILLRLPWDQTNYFATVVPQFADLSALPYDDPKIREAGNLHFQRFYRELKRAAFRRTADWEYPIGEVPLGDIVLPDVQGARDIVGRGLSIWIGHSIAVGNLTEAREGILVGFAVSRHYGRTPFVITQLVCAAIDSMMLARLEELVSQPQCPNLYWALTALPRPLIELGPSVELEQNFIVDTVPRLDDLPALKTEEQWRERVVAVIEEMRGDSALGTVEMGKLIQEVARKAREDRAAWTNSDAGRLDDMSDPEAALRWLLHLYQDRVQKSVAIMSLEPEFAIPQLARMDQDLQAFHSELGFSTLFVLARPLRIYLNIKRIERHIDALRVVEALRHYAATHESQLPESLDQIVDTPVPDDPLTGKPFLYSLSNGIATLRADGFDVDGKEVGVIHYRIKLQVDAP